MYFHYITKPNQMGLRLGTWDHLLNIPIFKLTAVNFSFDVLDSISSNVEEELSRPTYIFH